MNDVLKCMWGQRQQQSLEPLSDEIQNSHVEPVWDLLAQIISNQ